MSPCQGVDWGCHEGRGARLAVPSFIVLVISLVISLVMSLVISLVMLVVISLVISLVMLVRHGESEGYW